MRDLKYSKWKGILTKKGLFLLSGLVLVFLFVSSIIFDFFTPMLMTIQGITQAIAAFVYFLFITFLVGWLLSVYYIPVEGKRDSGKASPE
ncbi:MAG: hypothetical protein ACW991_10520 [Candidatus Hodarchaeales archaeon]|jgi:hypothetical protein